MALVIPQGTQDLLARGQTAPVGIVVDGSDSQIASVGSGYAAQAIARFNASRTAAFTGSPRRRGSMRGRGWCSTRRSTRSTR